jgi:hypothetical protein
MGPAQLAPQLARQALRMRGRTARATATDAPSTPELLRSSCTMSDWLYGCEPCAERTPQQRDRDAYARGATTFASGASGADARPHIRALNVRATVRALARLLARSKSAVLKRPNAGITPVQASRVLKAARAAVGALHGPLTGRARHKYGDFGSSASAVWSWFLSWRRRLHGYRVCAVCLCALPPYMPLARRKSMKICARRGSRLLATRTRCAKSGATKSEALEATRDPPAAGAALRSAQVPGMCCACVWICVCRAIRPDDLIAPCRPISDRELESPRISDM